MGVSNPLSRLQILGSLQLDPDPAVAGSGEIKSNTVLIFHPNADGVYNDSRIKFYSGGVNPTEIFTIDENTNVGVGIGSGMASSKLQVNGDFQVTGSNTPTLTKEGITLGNLPNYTWIQSKNNKPLLLNSLSDYNIGDSNGKTKNFVGIGFSSDSYTVPVGFSLAVKGKIITEGIRIKSINNWADYVFEKNYKLMDLADVEKFVLNNKHLPEIPSAQEVKDNGLDTETMDMLLLKKIEELTLYIIEQDKKIKKLEEASKK